MITEHLGILAPRGQRQQLRQGLNSLLGPTQVQPGCLSCRLFQNLQDLDELVIDAVWATEEDLIRHLQSDTFKRLLLLMELGRTPPVLQFHWVEQVSGLELVERVRNCLVSSEA
jgi:quinol monooxygenase YgiN